jgi:hypothetical protein
MYVVYHTWNNAEEAGKREPMDVAIEEANQMPRVAISAFSPKRVCVIPRLRLSLCRDSTLSPSRSSILSLRFYQNVPALLGRSGRMKSGRASCLTPVPGVSCQNLSTISHPSGIKVGRLAWEEGEGTKSPWEVIDCSRLPQALKLLWERANNASLSSLDSMSDHTCRMAVLTRGVASRMWFSWWFYPGF